MMPSAKIANANSPAIGRSASAACAEVWMLVMPCMLSVTAVATHDAQRDDVGEQSCRRTVSCLMRDRCSAAYSGCVRSSRAIGPALVVLDLLRGLPEEQVRADRGAEHGDHHCRRSRLIDDARREDAPRLQRLARSPAATAPTPTGSPRRRRTARASATSGRAPCARTRSTIWLTMQSAPKPTTYSARGPPTSSRTRLAHRADVGRDVDGVGHHQQRRPGRSSASAGRSCRCWPPGPRR